MAFVVTRKPPPTKIDLHAIAKVIGPAAVGAILKRTAAGKDVDGKAFAPYRPRTHARYLKMGEDPSRVDLRLTGGLMTSLAVRRSEVVGSMLRITIGPDTGTSPVVRPPSKGRSRAVRTGERGPIHTELGMWLHSGTPKMRPRPWLGLSPADHEQIDGLLRRLARMRR